MTLFVLIGGTAGLGLIAITAGFTRSRAPLSAVIGWYQSAGRARTTDPSTTLAGAAGAGAPLQAIGELLGARLLSPASRSRLRQDLNMAGRDQSVHATAIALSAIGGATLPFLLFGTTGLLGGSVGGASLEIAVLASVGLGLAAALVPGLQVRRAAVAARAAFLHSLACWLELVALAQAGGMGIEGALEAASAVTDEPSFVRLRSALSRARRAGRSPWEALAGLGSLLGVGELEELSASVGLAGTEGARIRSSLTAKSASLRRRQTAEAESRANATTERLFLPAIVLMVGFMVFLVYPAAATLSHVLR
jgi:tight adherence protein C